MGNEATKHAESENNVAITIWVKGDIFSCPEIKDKFIISANYSKTVIMNDLMNKIIKIMNTKYNSSQFVITEFNEESFTGFAPSESVRNRSICSFDKTAVKNKGLSVCVKSFIQRIICNGYLQQQSEYLKIFKKRWIEIKGDCLYSYKTKNNTEPTEVIDLKLAKYIYKLKGNKFALSSIFACFQDRVFIADSAQSRNQWIQCIKNEYNLQEVENKKNIIQINVNVKGNDYYCPHIKDEFVVNATYSIHQKMQNVLDEIMEFLIFKNYPLKLKINEIEKDSFMGPYTDHYIDILKNKAITKYDRNDIIKKGIKIEVTVNYDHKIKNEYISCPEMVSVQSLNPLKCFIYYKMKEKNEWKQEHLNHLNTFNHFKDEIGEKPECRYGDICKAFIRLENGGNAISDRCHLKIYRHPARRRNIKLAKNVNSFIFNKSQEENHKVYYPTDDEQKQWDKKDGFLNALIDEVIINGYKYDLCPELRKEIKAFIRQKINIERDINFDIKPYKDIIKTIHKYYSEMKNFQYDEYSILEIVDNKMAHNRHKAINEPLSRAMMLSLILYTGCECNYNLCASQRSGNYLKWIWFDRCLFEAIGTLSDRESGSFSVFSGINGVKLPLKMIKVGFFKTYISSSWNKNVAKTFMNDGGNDEGMIIEIDNDYKNHHWIKCCDVSWISKFEDESEILFARSVGAAGGLNEFHLTVLDETNGVQTVFLYTGTGLYKKGVFE